MNWIDLLKTIGPGILAVTPAAPFIPAVLAGVELAEELHAGAGNSAQKKATAQKVALAVAQGVNAAKNEPLVNADQLAAVTGTAIDTVVGVVNLTQKAAA